MAIKALDSTLPAATTLTDKKGKAVELFLEGNPSKVFAPLNFMPPKFFVTVSCAEKHDFPRKPGQE